MEELQLCSGSGLLTSGQEVPGSNSAVGMRLWVFAFITSPNPGVKDLFV
jgi:hypothetical protein